MQFIYSCLPYGEEKSHENCSKRFAHVYRIMFTITTYGCLLVFHDVIRKQSK